MPADKTLTVKPEQVFTLKPAQWVFLYADYLFGFAMMRLNDDEQAKDLVQETFLAALEKADQFKGKSSEKTWLTAILKNKVIDVYRKNASGFNKKTGVKEAQDEQQDFFDSDNGHWKEAHQPKEFGTENQDLLLNKEFNQVLEKCMQKLPALWLAVFTMKHLDEEATDFVCRELKISAANFWVVIHRTKLNLRACLQKNWL